MDEDDNESPYKEIVDWRKKEVEPQEPEPILPATAIQLDPDVKYLIVLSGCKATESQIDGFQELLLSRLGINAVVVANTEVKVFTLAEDVPPSFLSLDAVTLQHQVYAWLGVWRDSMGLQAVESLQGILGPLHAGEPKK
jgi:hypothetical protein